MFQLSWPTLIFTPDPKRFYCSWETQEGKVVSKWIYIRIWPVFARFMVHGKLRREMSCLSVSIYEFGQCLHIWSIISLGTAILLHGIFDTRYGNTYFYQYMVFYAKSFIFLCKNVSFWVKNAYFTISETDIRKNVQILLKGCSMG